MLQSYLHSTVSRFPTSTILQKLNWTWRNESNFFSSHMIIIEEAWKAVLWFSLSSSLSQPVVQQCLMRAPVPLIPPALDCGWMLAQGWWTVMATNDFLTAAPDSRVQWYSLHGVTMPYCLIPPWIHLKCMLMKSVMHCLTYAIKPIQTRVLDLEALTVSEWRFSSAQSMSSHEAYKQTWYWMNALRCLLNLALGQ